MKLLWTISMHYRGIRYEGLRATTETLIRNEVRAGWREFPHEELHNVFSFPNTRIIRAIESRRMRRTYYEKRR
jgi:hypothetical protein